MHCMMRLAFACCIPAGEADSCVRVADQPPPSFFPIAPVAQGNDQGTAGWKFTLFTRLHAITRLIPLSFDVCHCHHRRWAPTRTKSRLICPCSSIAPSALPLAWLRMARSSEKQHPHSSCGSWSACASFSGATTSIGPGHAGLGVCDVQPVPAFALNQYIVIEHFHILDMGGSNVIHQFGKPAWYAHALGWLHHARRVSAVDLLKGDPESENIAPPVPPAGCSYCSSQAILTAQTCTFCPIKI
eukprot:317625-Pelagomonas_calceolata.AAC.3